NSFRRVSPGECGLTSSDGDPGTNGVITKLAPELGIKPKSAILQGAIDGRARPPGAPFRWKDGPAAVPTSQSSAISFDSSFLSVELFGKCLASTLPIS